MEHKDEKPSDTEDSSDLSDEIVRSVREEQKTDDGLTRRERFIEESKQAERIRKAKELKKQLRKKELGLVKYRWSLLILLVAGFLSISTQFLPVMVHPSDAGFDNFVDGFVKSGSVFFFFPFIAGVIMVVCGLLAYNNPKFAWISLIPGMMMAMSGMTVYFLISFGLEVDPSATFSATGTPFTMLLIALVSVLAVLLRNRE
ncbi:MAG: hypothetical protein C4K47_05550 [Candidatus Thorarchaeota archaeon]|nr:MAG: hypothetical protein C4K47_05550 [Candidatus Thorarchaeota archaeon]